MLGMPWSFPTTTSLGAVPPHSPAAPHHREVAMSDLDDFLTPTLTRQLEAEKALINGDPGPRLAMWSIQEPVTVFGAEKTVIGSDEARQVFRWLATRFSNLTDYRFELVAAGASGDLAYTGRPSPGPRKKAVVRLVGAVLAEEHDEWIVARRYLGLDVIRASLVTVVDSTPKEELNKEEAKQLLCASA
jgi:hypothetical protein